MPEQRAQQKTSAASLKELHRERQPVAHDALYILGHSNARDMNDGAKSGTESNAVQHRARCSTTRDSVPLTMHHIV